MATIENLLADFLSQQEAAAELRSAGGPLIAGGG